jgi:hypothetical protein
VEENKLFIQSLGLDYTPSLSVFSVEVAIVSVLSVEAVLVSATAKALGALGRPQTGEPYNLQLVSIYVVSAFKMCRGTLSCNS